MDNGLTITQCKMLAVLADGLSHKPEDLHACLMDELGPLSNIQPHITAIRKVLRPIGQDVICQRIDGETMYRQVRLIASATDGRK